MLKRFPFFQQLDQMDCGAACLRMVAQYFGRSYSLQTLREKCYVDREGVSMLGISEGAESIGLRTLVVKLPYYSSSAEEPGLTNVSVPCIVHWEQRHFIVVYKINKKYVWVADPAKGKMKLSRGAFEKGWLSDNQKGLVLLLEPSPAFYEFGGETINRQSFSFLFQYFKPYKKLVIQLLFGLILGSIFHQIFPLLTKASVVIGIYNQDIGFIFLILI